MFKATPCLQKTLRRLPLSTKQAGKEYYKGNRVGSMGTIDKYGRFHPDFSKIRTYVYPERGIKGFELTPFVSNHSPKAIDRDGGRTWSAPAEIISGEEYLARWKREGGHDQIDMPIEQFDDSKTTMPEVWEEPARKS